MGAQALHVGHADEVLARRLDKLRTQLLAARPAALAEGRRARGAGRDPLLGEPDLEAQAPGLEGAENALMKDGARLLGSRR